jgi:membrane-bound serine protease (ClpP class)
MTLLSDPNVAFVLFVVGLAGILVELVHPTILGGVIGALCLVLAFIGFGGLPLNVAGLILLAFGMVLFALESQISTHGILAIGGLAAFVLGASMLYAPPAGTTLPAPAVATPVIVVVTASFALLMGAIIYAALRIRRLPAQREGVGTTPKPGAVGTVQAPLQPLGTVFLAGETWSARTADGRELDRDVAVRLVSFDGLVAVVAPDAAAPFAAPRSSVAVPPAAPPTTRS